MSNRPFDRTILEPLEKPLADDINQLQSNFDQTFRFYVSQLAKNSAGTPQDGFMANGFLVSPSSPNALSVTVSPGLGFQLQTGTEIAIDTVIGHNDLDLYKPIPLLAAQAFTVPTAPSAPNSRIDIIEVKATRFTTDPNTRKVLEENTGQFVPGTVNKTSAWAVDGRAAVVAAGGSSTAPLSYRTGVAAASPVAPAVTTGYIKVAEIVVGSDVTVITSANITDKRIPPRVVKIHHSPMLGDWNNAGTGFFGGAGIAVLPAAATQGTWKIGLTTGLQAGDVIENIEVIWNQDGTLSNNVTTTVRTVPVDLVAKTADVTLGNFSVVTTTAHATADTVVVHDHAAAAPTKYPLIWAEGSAIGVDFTHTHAASTRIISIVVTVRRNF